MEGDEIIGHLSFSQPRPRKETGGETSSSSSAPFSKMRKAEEDTRSRMKATFNNSQIENNFQVFFRAADDAAALLRTIILSYVLPPTVAIRICSRLSAFLFFSFCGVRGEAG